MDMCLQKVSIVTHWRTFSHPDFQGFEIGEEGRRVCRWDKPPIWLRRHYCKFSYISKTSLSVLMESYQEKVRWQYTFLLPTTSKSNWKICFSPYLSWMYNSLPKNCVNTELRLTSSVRSQLQQCQSPSNTSSIADPDRGCWMDCTSWLVELNYCLIQ